MVFGFLAVVLKKLSIIISFPCQKPSGDSDQNVMMHMLIGDFFG